jgi:hypothetical protein
LTHRKLSPLDLLRSGVDNAEVWELQLGTGWQENLVDSLPWRWNAIHHGSDNGDADGDAYMDDNHADSHTFGSGNNLSPAEQLSVGRGHSCCKISADKVVLFHGSGRPSTNGLIAFDLDTNTFHRPSVNGPLPKPRFTGVAVCLEEGFILTHGGYSTQESDAIGDWDVLDVAPALGRCFNFLPLDNAREAHAAVTNAQARVGRANRGQEALIERMYRTLLGQQAHLVWYNNDEDSEDDTDHGGEEKTTS